MRAWAVGTPGPVDGGPLVAVERPVPEPGPAEVRVRVRTCGVCRTDLHLAEGDLASAPARGGARARGRRDRRPCWVRSATLLAVGDRVGIPWLARTCGTCRFCRAGAENLCTDPRFTGWDVDGGYAEYAVVDEAFAYRLPDALDDDRRRPAAVRRDHRVPGAPAVRAASGRAARDLRIRGLGPPHRPGGAGRGGDTCTS